MNIARSFGMLLLLALSNGLQAQMNREAVGAFIRRIVQDRAGDFQIAYIGPVRGKDVFELESSHGKILLKGTNGLSVASALNYYLTRYCHCQITSNGIHLQLPRALPVITGKIRKETPYQYRYYLNYCTFNYTMSWWNWDRWQKEIDWMALQGINMPLAVTGEEAIWQKIYRDKGFDEKDLGRFFCGPAYFSWFWMGNLDGWGGPLPQHWIDSHKALQLQILAAERAMGMTPVLPAFTGHVPASFREKFPNARVKKVNWGAGFDDVYILDPSDPMFVILGREFLQAQTREYGSDHLYSADTFNENLPPTNDTTYLHDVSRKVFESMASADPKAIWVMQGWMFHYQSDFWQPAQIRALLHAVPDDHMIILDLYSESHPLWKTTHAYYGKPWIWCMLHNFGGNVSLWGRMDQAAADPAAALHDSASGKMAGIGLTPEGIENNPALYQLMTENIWNDQPIALAEWLHRYAWQRYGVENPGMDTAWRILASTVYQGGLGEGGPESIIVSRPTTQVWGDRVRTKLDYRPSDLLGAWTLFVMAVPQLKESDGFRYDLTDITRQVLANYATPLQQQWVLAYLQHDTAAFDDYTARFIGLMDDMDRLLATRRDFLLGRWIADARSCGLEPIEKDLYEFNARDLITLWGDKDSELHEYANRQWAGLISGFYKPRWQQYFVYLRAKMISGSRMETTDFDNAIKAWEWRWVNSRETYPSEPGGNLFEIVDQLYKKYAPQIQSPSR